LIEKCVILFPYNLFFC